MNQTTSSYVQWCNENEGRAYPFVDAASRVADDGTIMPDDIIVDLGIIISETHRNVYCTSVRVTPQGYSVCFASDQGALLVGTYAAVTYVPYTAVPLTPVAEDASGWIVFGSHKAVGVEQYRFAGLAQSGIVSRATRIIDDLPIRRILKLGGSPDIYVDKLVRLAGSGAFRTYRDATDPHKIIIELAAERAADFLGPCDHYPDASQGRVPPIRSINGVAPDSNGVITLRFIP